MIQCASCEHFQQTADGQVRFTCNPLTNIKEPECLQKWQLIKLDVMTAKIDTMVRAYQATLNMYERLAPLQEKMFKHMEREIDEADEADSWKFDADADEGDENDEDDSVF